MKTPTNRPWPDAFSVEMLNRRYTELPFSDEQADLIHDYFYAAASLYGIVPLSKLFDIINEYEPGLVTETTFLAFADVVRHAPGGELYVVGAESFRDVPPSAPMARELVDGVLIDWKADPIETWDSDYWQLKMLQEPHPYIVPPKEELLSYAEIAHVECAVDEFEALRALLFPLMRKRYSPEDKEFLLHEACAASIRGYAPPEVCLMRFFHICQDLCDKAFTPKQAKALVHNLMSYRIASRLPELCGDIPNVLRKCAPMQTPEPSEEEGYADDLLSPEPRAPKVGRNEPCPCGSGKKYKKCCGK